MKKILITVGERQFSERQIKSLQSLIVQNYKTFIAIESVLVLWNQVPLDNIHHNYKKSQPSILAVECEEGLEQTYRLGMFESCTRDWLRITGQRIDQLIITVLDTPVFIALLRQHNKHLTTAGKLGFFLRLLTHLQLSKISKGYYAFYSSR